MNTLLTASYYGLDPLALCAMLHVGGEKDESGPQPPTQVPPGDIADAVGPVDSPTQNGEEADEDDEYEEDGDESDFD